MPKRIVLFASDSPVVETGLAQVSKHILKKLHDTGKYDLHVIPCNHNVSWYDQSKFPYRIYKEPGSQDPYQLSFLADTIKNGGFDILFTCYDQQTVMPLIPVINEAKKHHRFKWIHYSPVDAYKMDKSFFQPWLECDYPLSYTNFGKDEAIKAHPELAEKLEVIYHGSDLELKVPENITETRQKIFGKHADKFIVAFVNRNQWRKDPFTLMQAFKQFNDKNPASVLYMHCQIHDKDYGTHLVSDAMHIGLKPGENVIFTGKDFTPVKGYSRKRFAAMLSSIDVMATTALGGGWELTTTECFAVGTPVIAPRNTCFLETIGENEERGYMAECGTTPAEWRVIYTKSGVPRPTTNIESMVGKLEEVYRDITSNSKALKNKIRNAYAFAHEFSWEKQAAKFVDVFDRAYAELENAGAYIDPKEYDKKLPKLYGKKYYKHGANGGYNGYNSDKLGHVLAAHVQAIQNLYAKKEYSTVLDVGCATGIVVNKFLEAGYDAYGCDISTWAIENTETDKDRVKVADVRNLEQYEDNSFDLVICSETLEHIPEEYLQKALSELYRVSRKFVCFSVPLGYKPADLHETHFTVHRREWWDKQIEDKFKYVTRRGLEQGIWNFFPLEKNLNARNKLQVSAVYQLGCKRQ